MCRNRFVVVPLMIAAAFTLAAPPADACCRPCRGFCTPFTDPGEFCCTGIPEPDNACGLTTCGEWFPGRRPAAATEETVDPLKRPGDAEALASCSETSSSELAELAAPLHEAQARPSVCDKLSCPALQDLCLKDQDQRACALHRLCC